MRDWARWSRTKRTSALEAVSEMRSGFSTKGDGIESVCAAAGMQSETRSIATSRRTTRAMRVGEATGMARCAGSTRIGRRGRAGSSRYMGYQHETLCLLLVYVSPITISTDTARTSPGSVVFDPTKRSDLWRKQRSSVIGPKGDSGSNDLLDARRTIGRQTWPGSCCADANSCAPGQRPVDRSIRIG